jgi:hypothetical protein
MAIARRKPIIQPMEKVREVYKTNSALFGLLQWEELQRSERIGSELWIRTEFDVEHVIINGKRITI